jgi:lipoprotein NlpD
MVARRLIRSSLGALALTLLGCTSSLPVYENRVHVVMAGETLYTIAWRHGLDYRDLARWNGLDNPDYLRVGQRLVLRPSAVPERVVTAPRATNAPSAAPPSRAPRPAVAEPAVLWRWPTAGPLLSRFGAPGALANGIGIGGQVGQPVRAAAAGRIVYAGSGLIGYGQLVIIKHNDTYLSAYGHNRRLLVAQGQTVAAGETIAEMGYGPEREPRLHFEIRRDGTPVDPLPLLPALR